MDTLRALLDSETPDGVMRIFDREARALGAASVGYFIVQNGRKARGWSTTDPAWRKRYVSINGCRADPEYRAETRLSQPTAIRYADGHPGAGRDRWAGRLYDEARAFGYSGVLFVPDRTPSGLRELATLNAMSAIPEPSFKAWAAREGAQIMLLAETVLVRMRMLRSAEAAAAAPLTEREREVLHYLASGLRIAEIADRMALSPKTVEFHLGKARSRLGARTRDQAVAMAAERGWLGTV